MFFRNALLPVLALPLFLGACKTRMDQSEVKADIQEVDKPVRAIYKDVDGFVYLVTCPKENGQFNDHFLDEKAIRRADCNARNAALNRAGMLSVRKLKYQEEYLPRLKEAIGFSDKSPASTAEAEKVKAQITQFENGRNRLAGLVAVSDDVNKKALDGQVAKLSQKIEELRVALGAPDAANRKIALLETLVGYLEINSEVTLNIAEANAGYLLDPFKDVPVSNDLPGDDLTNGLSGDIVLRNPSAGPSRDIVLTEKVLPGQSAKVEFLKDKKAISRFVAANAFSLVICTLDKEPKAERIASALQRFSKYSDFAKLALTNYDNISACSEAARPLLFDRSGKTICPESSNLSIFPCLDSLRATALQLEP